MAISLEQFVLAAKNAARCGSSGVASQRRDLKSASISHGSAHQDPPAAAAKINRSEADSEVARRASPRHCRAPSTGRYMVRKQAPAGAGEAPAPGPAANPSGSRRRVPASLVADGHRRCSRPAPPATKPAARHRDSQSRRRPGDSPAGRHQPPPVATPTVDRAATHACKHHRATPAAGSAVQSRAKSGAMPPAQPAGNASRNPTTTPTYTEMGEIGRREPRRLVRPPADADAS